MLYLLFCGVWGLGLALQRSAVGGGYLGALIICQGLILVQGALGVLLVILGLRPSQWVHILYGITLAVALPAAHLYGRGRAITYGLVALFAFGLALRGITTT